MDRTRDATMDATYHGRIVPWTQPTHTHTHTQPRTHRTMDTSYHGRIVHHKRIVPWTHRTMDASYHGRIVPWTLVARIVQPWSKPLRQGRLGFQRQFGLRCLYYKDYGTVDIDGNTISMYLSSAFKGSLFLCLRGAPHVMHASQH